MSANRISGFYEMRVDGRQLFCLSLLRGSERNTYLTVSKMRLIPFLICSTKNIAGSTSVEGIGNELMLRTLQSFMLRMY